MGEKGGAGGDSGHPIFGAKKEPKLLPNDGGWLVTKGG